MAKRKSSTTIRLSEIGRCIRYLHSTRLELLTQGNYELGHGLAHAITVLGEYKRSIKAASKGEA